MKEKLISVLTIGGLLLIIAVMCINIFGKEDKPVAENTESTTFVCELPTAVPTETTTVPAVTTTLPVTTVAPVTTLPDITQAVTEVIATSATVQEQIKPETTKEIIDKYSQLVNDFKAQKPAYKKKEYQEMPEEHRNFGSAVNVILAVASGYMVTEDECEELVRPAGSQDILLDMPVHNTEKGCVLTDYDAVTWAKSENLGDGTVKLSFSLKEEVNAEPTPADTLVPTSAHGAVMQPLGMKDLMIEVDKVVKSLPGIDLNEFSLYYRDCEFNCIYNPETNQVLSITHHIVIDIVADVTFFGSEFKGSCRLLNEMLIYDITW